MPLELIPPDREERVPPELPCVDVGPDLFFSEVPGELEAAKLLCQSCPARAVCLAGAIERGEPWGVWGGEVFHLGEPIPFKRSRGRPRKHPVPPVPVPIGAHAQAKAS
jgi:WhiB family redox-sensing transcriptional regulator